MPELVRLYIRHVLIGVALSIVFVGLLLWLNVAGLGHLVAATREGPIAVLMLVVFNAIVFSGVQFAFAVMGMAEKPKDGGKGRRAPARHRGEPVAVEVPAAKPRRP